MDREKTYLLDWGRYIRFVCYIVLLLTVYASGRLCFFLFNSESLSIDNFSHFLRIFQGGLLFDLSAIAYTNILFALLLLSPVPMSWHNHLDKLGKFYYFVVNSLALILNFGDIIYYQFTGRRTTVAVFKEFKDENPIRFLRFFWDYLPLTLIGLSLIVLWIFLYNRLERRILGVYAWKVSGKVYYGIKSFLLLILIYLSIGAIRGSFGDARPIRPSAALRYTHENPRQAVMVLNTPFVVIRLLGDDPFPLYHYMSDEEAVRYFNPKREVVKPSPFFARFKGRNVVLLIWESCSKEWVGHLNQDIEGYEGYTPFLDSLLKKSFYFERAFANGHISVDAMPSLLAGVPKPNISYVASPYAMNRLNSLPQCLKKVGYQTAFFHNAPRKSMSFDAMANNLSFGIHRSMEDFNDDKQFDGTWGIWDEPFLQYVIGELNEMKEPFFATEFTTSSHTPFVVPAEYETRFPEEVYPFHRVIRYSDYAIQRFFEEAKKCSWYENTLFVLVADHAVAPYIKEYKTNVGHHSIPLLFFDPKGEFVQADKETVVQQSDLLPSLLDLLGVQEPIVAFGQNMFAPEEKHFAYCSLGSAFQMVQGDYALTFDGEKVLTLYNYRKDRYCKRNIKNECPDVVAEMLPYLKAYLQSFSIALHKDHLSFKADSSIFKADSSIFKAEKQDL